MAETGISIPMPNDIALPVASPCQLHRSSTLAKNRVHTGQSLLQPRLRLLRQQPELVPLLQLRRELLLFQRQRYALCDVKFELLIEPLC